MVSSCCIFHCKNTSATTKLHIFPKDRELRNKWSLAINRMDLTGLDDSKRKNYKVCDIHFDNKYKFPAMKNKTNLKATAVPSLFLQADLSETILEDPHVPGPSSAENVHSSLNVIANPTDSSVASHKDPDFELPMDEDIQCTTDTHQKRAGSPLARPAKVLRITTPVHFKTTLKTKLLGSIGVRKQAQLTPKARKLYRVASDLKKIAKRLDYENTQNKERLQKAKEYAETSTILTGKVNNKALNFILCQLRMQKRSSRGRRYSFEDKVFALSLLKQGPRAYKILRKTFALPSRRTLMTLLNRIPFETGLNEKVMEVLKDSVKKMGPLDRNCAVLFDEISLEPGLSYEKKKDIIVGLKDLGDSRELQFADHAMVFMARGLHKNWKQPISYYFSKGGLNASEIKKLLHTNIKAIQDIGLNVVATICDQYSANQSAIQKLVETTNEATTHSELKIFKVEGEEIVALYDPPHLLKGIRNNLLNNDVKFKLDDVERKASWIHIREIYEMDTADQNTRMCNSLTDQHIYPEKLKKMKVSYAAQVLSKRVAATIKWTVKYGKANLLSPFAEDTAEFVSFMDDLFDSVNGFSPESDRGKILRSAVKPKSPHWNFWIKSIKILRTAKFTTKKGDRVPPSITNWITTLRGLLHIWIKLKNAGFKYLCTRNLNQDPLENFFGQIRSHGIRNTNPTCTSFVHSFKTLIVNNFTSSHSPGANCEIDNNNSLSSLEAFLHVDEVAPVIPEGEDLNYDCMEFPFTEVDETRIVHTHAYIAGYIAKSLTAYVKGCQTCRHQLVSQSASQEHGLIELREYGPNLLVKTRTQFRRMFTKMVYIFNRNIPEVLGRANIKYIFKGILIKHLYNPFICREHDMFNLYIEKFLVFFMFTYVMNINKILKGQLGIDRNETDILKKIARVHYIKLKSKKRKIEIVKQLT